MKIIDNFQIKRNNISLNPPSYSHKLIKHRKFPNFNNNMNRELYKNPFGNYNNILPQIKKSTIPTVNKKHFYKKSFNIIEPNSINSEIFNNRNNLSNSSIFQINHNIISIKKSPLFNKKIKQILNCKNVQSGQKEKPPDINIQNIKNNLIKEKHDNLKRSNSLVKNENAKNFEKAVNIYFKSNFNSNEINNENVENIENVKKEEEEEHIPKTKSMFMTGMNFLMPSNIRNKNKNEINSENNYNKKLENKDENINYNCLSFKELLKHIEENKKKIIDNQNDIEKMLMTAKDTHIEIWKCNHYKK